MSSKDIKSKEKIFQKALISDITALFPGCIILKNDAQYCSGIPDLLILYNKHWAALECKRYCNAIRRPNQEYYICRMNQMSYASFVYPENKEVVLDELQHAFQT